MTRVNLDTAGTAYRWFLVWIEKFAPGQEQVSISEARPLPLIAALGGVPLDGDPHELVQSSG